MAKLVNVKSLVDRVAMDKPILGSYEIDKLYGQYSELVFKDEVKMIVPGDMTEGPIELQANILTKRRIDQIKSQKFKGMEPNFLHLGVVPIVIQSLMLSGNEFVSGRCALVDTSQGDEKRGIIDQFKFKWTKDEPFAAKVLVINGAVDINCTTSIGSIQILISIEGIRLRSSRSIAAIITGLTCTPTNSQVMLPGLKRETPKWNLINTLNISEDDDAEIQMFKELFNASNHKLIDMGKEEIIYHGKSIWKPWRIASKPVTRRTMTKNNMIKYELVQGKSELEGLKREVTGCSNLINSYCEVCEHCEDVFSSGQSAENTLRSGRLSVDSLNRFPKSSFVACKECSRGRCRVDERQKGRKDHASTSCSEIPIWEYSGQGCKREGGLAKCSDTDTEYNNRRNSCEFGNEPSSDRSKDRDLDGVTDRPKFVKLNV